LEVPDPVAGFPPFPELFWGGEEGDSVGLTAGVAGVGVGLGDNVTCGGGGTTVGVTVGVGGVVCTRVGCGIGVALGDEGRLDSDVPCGPVVIPVEPKGVGLT
jgi:hypothetical protein